MRFITIVLLLVAAGFAAILPNSKLSLGATVIASPETNEAKLVDGKFSPSNGWTFSAGSWAAIQLTSVPDTAMLLWSAAAYNWSDAIPSTQTCKQGISIPTAYEILISTNSTDGSDGDWTQLDSVSGNVASARAHLISLNGASWVKLIITEGSGLLDELEIFDADNGVEDSWFFMGTSITNMTMRNYISDSNFQKMVQVRNSAYTPAMIRGGVSCITSSQVVSNISDYLNLMGPVHFLAIEMGTNDGWNNGTSNLSTFVNNIQLIIDSARARGIEPIIARPMSTNPSVSDGGWQLDTAYAIAVDSLQQENNLWAGPDFYSYFLDNPSELSASDGVHPTLTGAKSICRLWANAMIAGPYYDSTAVLRTTPKAIGVPSILRVYDLLGRTQE
ncbi:MAG TPA: SGNH/GDSL hydrolase family protein [Fibrobacteraceae bacterium]|nr:SGNH/GDSL hydrolase family protein [Fibrobacteraceae bacterium]